MKNEAKSYSVKFYAEKKLDDGRVIATEDEQFAVGSKVFAISDDGEAQPLEAGTYTFEDGDKLVIGDSSQVVEMGEVEVAEDEIVEASKEEELSEEAEELAEEDESIAEETDWAKTFEEMKDRVAELEKAVFGEKAEEETEDLSEDKTEMSSEIIGDLMTQIEELNSKIVKLSGEPAEDSIKYSPEGTHFSSTVNLAKMSTKDRVAYYINRNK